MQSKEKIERYKNIISKGREWIINEVKVSN